MLKILSRHKSKQLGGKLSFINVTKQAQLRIQSSSLGGFGRWFIIKGLQHTGIY